MDGELKKFLSLHSVSKEEAFTHTSRKPNGSFFVDLDNFKEASEFWKLYKNAVAKEAKLTLMEKPRVLGPLRFDFDFAWPITETQTRKYTVGDVNKLVKGIQKIIKQVVDPNSPQEKTAWCVLLEKQSPRTDAAKQVHKDGFHLHFPFMIVEGKVLEFITKKVKDMVLNDGIFDDKPFDKQKIVDSGLSKKTWLMYASAKDSVSEPFLVTKYYKDTINTHGYVCAERDQRVFWSEFVESNEEEDPNFHLPSLLSIIQVGTPTPLAPEVVAQLEASKPRSQTFHQAGREEKDVLNDIDAVRALVEMLSPSRADSYDTWMDVGWTLFNIGLGHALYLELWIDFSRKSNKFIGPEDLEERWRHMTLRGKTMGSLRRMAGKDNPAAYSVWCKTQENFYLEESLKPPKPLENLVAKLVHHLYKDMFVCAHTGKQLWYTFLGNRWSQIDGEGIVQLRRKITDEVANKYLEFNKIMLDKAVTTQDSTLKASLAATGNKAYATWTELQKAPFVNKVVSMCSDHFYDNTFIKKFDENKMLFGCNNGVLDLANFTFRETRPDDYVTLSCGVDYCNFSMEHPDVKAVVSYFRKVFTDPALYDYFFNTLCACLEGGNPNKNFVIHTGPSGGGKTATMEFIMAVFGEYAIKFPRELFVEGVKTSSAQARPELERVRGKRLAMGQEITHRERFNIGVLKELTGNDSFFARTLHDKGGDIKPMFTLMVCCNNPPQFPGDDDATYDRLKMLEYDSKFVLPAQLKDLPVSESEAEQFRMRRFRADLRFDDDRKKELAPAFLWYLFERYKIYKRTGLIEPARVAQHVKAYRSRHDPYELYVSEKLEKVEDNDIKLSLTNMFNDYTMWFRITFNTPQVRINKPEFKDNISKKIGNPTMKGNVQFWPGYRLRDVQKEEDEVFKSAEDKSGGGSSTPAVVTAPSSSQKKQVKSVSRAASSAEDSDSSSSSRQKRSHAPRN